MNKEEKIMCTNCVSADTEREEFIGKIMDLLVAINMVGDEKKEKAIYVELENMDWDQLNKCFDQANEIAQMQRVSEILDKILRETEEFGAEAVKIKYGLD